MVLMFVKNLNVRKKVDLTLFTFALSYFVVLFVPAYFKLIQEGALFGIDVSHYILTAKSWVEGKSNIFMYSYPIVPLLYVIPSLIIKDPLALYVLGNFVSIFITTMGVIAMYYLLKMCRENSIANITGAMIFGTFPLLLDTIGWGGQSTLLATFFGILTLLFVQRRIHGTSAKPLMFSATLLLLSSLVRRIMGQPRAIAATLLLLSSLTEPYVTTYFLIATGIIILLKNECRLNILLTLKEMTPLFPALMIIFVIAFALEIHEKEYFITLAEYMLSDFDIITRLLSRLTFDNIILTLGIIFIPLMYTLLRLLAKRIIMNDGGENNFILISSAIACLVIFLLTPSQYADRSLFFLSIPLAIVVNDSVYVAVSTKSRNMIATLALVCFMFSLLLPANGINIYTNSFDFYHIDKNFLVHMLPLQQVDGGVLSISPSPYHAFPLAYISGKDVYPTIQPVWFIREPQINATILAFTSAWGVRWIDAGEIKVVDASPLWSQPAPAIYVTKYPYVVELFRLSDGLLPIEFSPSNNESIIWGESPFYAKEKSFWVESNTMFSRYTWDTLTIVKSINVDENGVVNIVLNYSFVNSVPHRVDIRLISLMLKDTKVRILFSNETQTQVSLIQSFKEPWYRQYYDTLVESYVKSTGVRQEVKFVESDEWGLPEVVFTLTPITHVDTISVSIRVKINDVQMKAPRIVLRENALLDNDIKFVIIDKLVHQDVLRLFEEDPNFKKYKESWRYVIFSVERTP